MPWPSLRVYQSDGRLGGLNNEIRWLHKISHLPFKHFFVNILYFTPFSLAEFQFKNVRLLYLLLSHKWWSERSFTSITVICVVVVSYLCASHQSRFPNSHVWISKWLTLTFHVKIQRISLEIQRKIHGNLD